MFAFTLAATSLMGQHSLNLASDVWPPFTNKDGQKTIALDLVEAAFFRMNEPMEVHITSFTQVLEGLENGQYEGCGAMWKTPERESNMLFSDPYIQNRLVLVSLKTADPDTAMTIRKVGAVSSYAYDVPLLQSKKVEVLYNDSDQENLNFLLAGKIDLMLADELLIHYLLQAQKEKVDELLDISSPIAVKSLHLAISKHVPAAESLIARFNTEIENMITDGVYHDVLELNWITADIDGDGKTEHILKGDTAGSTAPESSYALFYNDSTKTAGNSYHVNGTLYETWEDVPAKYKENMYDSPNDPAKGNMIIKF